jgi:GntR family transcriptional regulator/MocR family aminotransferase
MYPALRLGYLALPPDMVERAVAARSLTDRQTPTVDQRTLAAFIEEGHFERHLAKMRRLYADRRTATVEALARELSGLHSCDAAETAAGLHLLASLHTSLPEAALVDRLLAAGIRVDGASPCYLAPPEIPGIMLGYAALPDPVIAEGIRRLASVVRAAPVRSVA